MRFVLYSIFGQFPFVLSDISSAKLIVKSIENYTIPDEYELRRLEEECRDSDAILLKQGHNETTWHNCKDDGLGICHIVGCTPEYEEVF